MLNPVQPAAMDPARVKREYGRDLCFWGSMDEQHTLPFGTPTTSAKRCSTGSRRSAPTAGSSSAPTHHLQLDTPLENFWAMVEAVAGSTRLV